MPARNEAGDISRGGASYGNARARMRSTCAPRPARSYIRAGCRARETAARISSSIDDNGSAACSLRCMITRKEAEPNETARAHGM